MESNVEGSSTKNEIDKRDIELLVLLQLPEEDREELRQYCVSKFSSGCELEDVIYNLHRRLLKKCDEKDIPLKNFSNKVLSSQVQDFVNQYTDEHHLDRGYN